MLARLCQRVKLLCRCYALGYQLSFGLCTCSGLKRSVLCEVRPPCVPDSRSDLRPVNRQRFAGLSDHVLCRIVLCAAHDDVVDWDIPDQLSVVTETVDPVSEYAWCR